MPSFATNRFLLRIGLVVLALTGVLGMSGCWVTSINGLDESTLSHPDPDKIFDTSLVGSWGITSDNCSSVLKIGGSDHVYNWEWRALSEACTDKEKVLYYESELFRLDNHLFLDLSARSEDVCELCRAVHWIFLLRVDKDSLTLTPIDSEWLKQAKEQNTVTLATLPDDTDTIMASAKDLKAFCRKYADDKNVFQLTSAFVFKRQ
jgi:hypothetical protein